MWLGVNLVTVFMAAWVIGLFEVMLNKIVVLAVLMPIVARMGGITGILITLYYHFNDSDINQLLIS